MAVKLSFYSLTYQELGQQLNQHKLPPEGSRQLFNWHYKKRQIEKCTLHNFSSKTEKWIEENLEFVLPQIQQSASAADKTVKFLFALDDGKSVEAVLIPFQKKYTVCLSSQVGCQMKCSFCYTGQQGFLRNLTTSEIVGQFVQIQRWLSQNRPGDDRILNIVFMGQGEPLHNFDSVKKACEIFISQYGLSIACHKITVSTAGYLPGLKRWKAEMPNVNIALSLHAVDSHKRNQLIPLNKSYPLSELLPYLEDIPQDKKRFVTYEYLVLADFNDSDKDIHEMGQLLQGKKAYVNLIPFNPIPGAQYKRPSAEKMDRIKYLLESYQIPTTVRTTKGDPILAACGQLYARQT